MKSRTLISLLAAFAIAGVVSAKDKAAKPLGVGDKAPAIDTFDQDGNPVKLGEEFKSGTTLVWFYPKANTSG
jgi:hypothetical protein